MQLTSTNSISLTPGATSRERLQTAARELEAQFAKMMIESMRSASLGDSLLGDNTMYRDMYDRKLSRELTKGDGLGLASIIARQLARDVPVADADGQPSAAATVRLDNGAAIPLVQNLRQAMPLTPPLAAPMPLVPMTLAPMTLAPMTLAPMPTTSSTGMLALAPTNNGVSLSAIVPVQPPTIAPLPQPGQVDACDRNAPLDCSTPEAFVRSIWPHAKRTAAELGISPKALVAQAALETGWGRRLVGGDDSHNLFGIKATGGWDGDRVNSATHEFVNGQRQNQRADFRAYSSVHDSFADYAQLMHNDRYAGALAAGTDADRFATALQQAGYATDPAYAAKISAIVDGPTLRRALATLPDTRLAYAGQRD